MKYIILLLMVFSGTIVNAKHHKCLYTHLSRTYDFMITYDVLVDSNELEYIPAVHIFIIQKAGNKIVQRIESTFNNGEPCEFAFSCTSRSYVTGYRKNASTVDGYWGDIIVADFNFDGREDFAVRKWESPMDAPIEPCDFYIQNDKGKFFKDKYLSSQLGIFPGKIDASKHTLSMRFYIGANPEVHEEKFRYNSKKHRWSKIK